MLEVGKMLDEVVSFDSSRSLETEQDVNDILTGMGVDLNLLKEGASIETIKREVAKKFLMASTIITKYKELTNKSNEHLAFLDYQQEDDSAASKSKTLALKTDLSDTRSRNKWLNKLVDNFRYRNIQHTAKFTSAVSEIIEQDIHFSYIIEHIGRDGCEGRVFDGLSSTIRTMYEKRELCKAQKEIEKREENDKIISIFKDKEASFEP